MSSTAPMAAAATSSSSASHAPARAKPIRPEPVAARTGSSYQFQPVQAQGQQGPSPSAPASSSMPSSISSHSATGRANYVEDSPTPEEEPEPITQQVQSATPPKAETQVYDRYERVAKLGEGTYGIVFKARDKQCEDPNKFFALKRVRLEEGDQGVSTTAMREIAFLKRLSEHDNIVMLHDIHIDQQRNLHLVFEYLDYDLKKYMDRCRLDLNQHVPMHHVKMITYQLIRGVQQCHEARVLHRDLKPQNILLDTSGSVKVADFGLARSYTHHQPGERGYTTGVVTLWYRPPEILLGATEYGPWVDMWSIGCILAEMVVGVPLFPGDSELDQIIKIFQMLGKPDQHGWPEVVNLPDFQLSFPNFKPVGLSTKCQRLDEQGMDLLRRLLAYKPEHRMTASEALSHPYFHDYAVSDLL